MKKNEMISSLMPAAINLRSLVRFGGGDDGDKLKDCDDQITPKSGDDRESPDPALSMYAT